MSLFNTAPAGVPCLPQSDPDPDARALDLRAVREFFPWSRDYLPELALLAEPGSVKPSASRALLFFQSIPPQAFPEADYLVGRGLSLGRLVVAAGLNALNGKAAFTDLDDYIDIIRFPLRVPEMIKRWREDEIFAYQRVAGANPLVIRGVDALPANFAISDETLQGVWRSGLTLEGELAAGNLFVCDYSILNDMPVTRDEDGTRRSYPCLALFHVDRAAAGQPNGRSDAPLLPLAIQLGLEADPARVFTPKDGPRWLVARFVVQCADVSLHEMGPHLMNAHFMEETFAVATWRQLSAKHPIHALLTPHLRILLFNNFEGRQLLVNPGGAVDSLMGGGIHAGMETMLRDYSGDPSLLRKWVTAGTREVEDGQDPYPWSMQEWDVPIELGWRRAERIPSYPYADDARLLWGALSSYVSDYLGLYYIDDQAVVDDGELQAWVAELQADEGGRVRGLEQTYEEVQQLREELALANRAAGDRAGTMKMPPCTVTTVEHLARVLTRLIYACGPLHSALNFAQYECILSPIGMPLALYAELPADLHTWDDARVEDYLFKLLPPPDKARDQMNTIVGLTSFHYDRLGYYKAEDMRDPAAVPIIERFQARLGAIAREIDARNGASTRPVPYTVLHPDRILNSTSI